jgi:hypothetical protein
MVDPRWSILLIAASALLLAACGGSSRDVGWDARGIAQSQDGVPFFPILATSPPAVGPARLAIGLTDNGALLPDATVAMRVYRLAEEPQDAPNVADLRAEWIATPRSIVFTSDHKHDEGTSHPHQGPTSTVYVANVVLDEAGWWGIEVDVELDGERYEGVRFSFWVRDESDEPGIGAAVPRSTQRTLRDVSGISEIDTSDPPHPEFHELTIAEALDTGKPVVVAFVTPAFCQTRFCGPVMEEVILPTHARYGDTIEIVHIEPFDLEAMRRGVPESVPVVEEWGLLSEPFVFVLNPDGTVAAKFEGIMEAEEIAAALDALLSP